METARGKVGVWNFRVESFYEVRPMGYNLVMAVEEFKTQVGAMYLAWGR